MVKVKSKKSSETSEKGEKKAKKKVGGFHKAYQPDKVLAGVLGSSDPISRPQITKTLWANIKSTKGMQEGRTIHASAGGAEWLEFTGGKKSIEMFDLPVLVSKHIKKD